VDIPYAYAPRPYQQALWTAFQDPKIDRGVIVWPRRSGKDTSVLNLTITRMLARPGLYYHLFPEFAQGRRILWEGMRKDGFRFRDHFHPSIVGKRKDGSLDMDEQEMRVRLVNGAIWQILGTDDYDKARGTNPIGVVLSEYSYQNPKAWQVLAPILDENNGWAIFDFTPQGKNHAWKLFNEAQALPNWFVERLTILDTRHIELAKLEEQRALGLLSEEDIQQEYYCSFESGSYGSYYGRLVAKAYDEGRVTRVPWDPMMPVETWWDIGVNDQTAIWFVQQAAREIRVIDFYENQGEGLPHYAAQLARRAYLYSEHLFPHDMANREFGTGRARIDVAWELGLRPSRVIERTAEREDGIEAVRRVLPQCVFNQATTQRGLDGLSSYRKAWDPKLQVFKKQPTHDWASNIADAFRTGATGHNPFRGSAPTRQLAADISYDVQAYTAQPVAPVSGAKWGSEYVPYTRRLPQQAEAIR
jgi:hypothetical protein